MDWARYGPDKKSISALFYRQEKHGEIFCKFCDGKMIFVRPDKKAPHFRVNNRESHTCKYFSNAIEDIVESCNDTVRIDRKNNESPVFHLNFEKTNKIAKGEVTSTKFKSDNEYIPYVSTSYKSIMQGKAKLKTHFKFIADMYSLILKNPADQVLKCRFTIHENGVTKKVKAVDLIPNIPHLITLNEKNKLSDRKRFIVGTILSAKETKNKNIEITLYGEKIDSGYINHKIIIMKNACLEAGLSVSDFYRDRFIVFYIRPKIEKKNEILSFVNSYDDFEFGKLTAKDGDWCDSKDEKKIDDFLYRWRIEHDVPDIDVGKKLFEVQNNIDRFYVPDWILYIEDKKVVMEYFGFYTQEYMERKARKIEYFTDLKDYLFIGIDKIDIDNDFEGLKNKLCNLFPRLRRNWPNHAK